MSDSDKLLPAGVPQERLNGLTPEQFRGLIVQTEAAMMGMFKGNTGMMATAIVELIVRMAMDADELGREIGDKLMADIHHSLDETFAYWRVHYAKVRADLEAQAPADKAKLN